MWHTDAVDLERAMQLEVKSHAGRRMGWLRPPTAPYGKPLMVCPLDFLYAASRTAATGTAMSVQSVVASMSLGASAMAYLEPRPALAAGRPHKLHLNPAFGHAKDFVGTAVKGVIGASLAYLEMQGLGYAWHGHFEDCVTTAVSGRRPDFVFASSTEICLVDAKGSSASMRDLAKHVKDEWREQIKPCLGVKLASSVTPTEGRIIGARLSATGAAELVTAYGRSFPAGSAAAAAVPIKTTIAAFNGREAGVAAVQRANYFGASLFLGFQDLADALNPRADSGSAVLAALTYRDRGNVRRFGRSYVHWLADGSAWQLDSYIRGEVLRAVINKFIRNQQVAIPMNAQVDDAELRSDEIIIESRDGVGVRCTLLPGTPSELN